MRPPSAPPEARTLPTVLRARDHDPGSLARLARAGILERTGRGAYRRPDSSAADWREHEARVLARAVTLHHRLTQPHWFSHETAALLWGCALVRYPDLVHVTQLVNPSIRSEQDPHVVRHWTELPRADQAVCSGLPVTCLERTVVDCARALPEPRALVVADSALRLGARRAVVEAILARSAGKRHVRRARRVIAMADGAAESPGESLARFAAIDAGLPTPALQHEIRTRLGSFWVDLAWVEARVAVEFDGFVKYDELALSGAAQVVFEEKRRQEAIEEAGWLVVRITWADLDDLDALALRLRAALTRPRRIRHPHDAPAR